MTDFGDIIVATITGPQRAPVAILRCSGSGCWQIAREICPKSGAEPRTAYLSPILVAGEELDEGFLLLFEDGHSYTGEESFEVSCHGSPEMVRRIVATCVALGARPARAGEFTERAFLNGRIDLTRAEAIRETIEAATDAQQRRAKLLREGHLADRVKKLQEQIGTELAKAEATVDFSEEIGELDREQSSRAIEEVIAGLDRLLSGYQGSRLLRHGLRVVLAGRPNVGKSSLMNALLGLDRAIVTDIPGTTRDTIEETVSICGYPVVLTDTAGLREGTDAVEKLGVERTRSAIETADEIWFIYESNLGWLPDDQSLLASLARKPSLLLANKSDIPAEGEAIASQPQVSIRVSALTADGLDAIETHVRHSFEQNAQGEPPLINERHREDLDETKILLLHACETLQSDLPTDLVCVDLYGALQTIGRITGETAPQEIIERVFRDFCIGK